MKVMEIKNVRKSYGNKEILHGVNLSVEEGSIHGLVGRNGCGKTTLMKCMTGIYKQEEGEILIGGQPVYENPEVKAQVGYVADSNQYFDHYRIDEMVEFYRQMYLSFDQQAFFDYNQCVGLEFSKRIRELSKGQSMALASMLNLSIHPKIIIMDEPLSGLDVIVQKQVKDFIINEVEMKGMSVLISSHDLKDLESFCDSISMMKKGKIIHEGTIDDVKSDFAKIQVVFSNGLPNGLSEIPGLVTYSNLGSIYTMILTGYSNVIEKTLKEMGASFVEEIPMTLEEIFIYSNQ
ncbi:ATP-binding cassette domain-containing protein [Anaerostipes sp.]|uniref:ATP-binding cassette domain-containing protein n=1 Tax=Anaerostipes sp. TaxID=1872530 RepID=UPI003FED6315